MRMSYTAHAYYIHAGHPGPTNWPANGTVDIGREIHGSQDFEANMCFTMVDGWNIMKPIRAASRDRLSSETLKEMDRQSVNTNRQNLQQSCRMRVLMRRNTSSVACA